MKILRIFAYFNFEMWNWIHNELQAKQFLSSHGSTYYKNVAAGT